MSVSLISGIGGVGPALLPSEGQPAGAVRGGPSFADTLRGFVETTKAQQAEAEKRTEEFITGGTGDLHAVAIAGTKAEIAFRLMMTVRNKLIDAYREVMRMGA